MGLFSVGDDPSSVKQLGNLRGLGRVHPVPRSGEVESSSGSRTRWVISVLGSAVIGADSSSNRRGSSLQSDGCLSNGRMPTWRWAEWKGDGWPASARLASPLPIE